MLPPGDLHVAPSVLSADFGALAEAVALVEPVTSWLHLDVMDGHFVPNLSIGPPVIASLRRHTGAFFDCHLMVTNPGDFLEAFHKAGADLTTVHVEVGRTRELLAEMRGLGLSVGLALNPGTAFEEVEPFLGLVDLLLVMTVVPGFGGQSFMAEVLPKVRRARAALEQLGSCALVEVDGGIAPETAGSAARAGARVLVAGSAVFDEPDPAGAALAILRAARSGSGGPARSGSGGPARSGSGGAAGPGSGGPARSGSGGAAGPGSGDPAGSGSGRVSRAGVERRRGAR